MCTACPGERVDSLAGAAECTLCEVGTFQVDPSSPASDLNCKICGTGLNCSRTGTTINTVQLQDRYWRHSEKTDELWRCKQQGDHSPCLGGPSASRTAKGSEGDGYCKEGYRGPRCEICDN
eukprot:7387484-Prymnesium_polylepis.1